MISKVLDESDVGRFKNLLRKSERIVLTCHVRPDGDAVGSTLGFYHVLKSLGKDVYVITPDMPPRSLSFLPGFRSLVPYTKYGDYAERLLSGADLLICCDFNKLSRLDAFSEVIGRSVCKKVLVDHHQFPDYFADITFSFPSMSSTCELVFRIIAALGYADVMDKDAAECIMAGIITDTRNLSVNCADPELYLIMYELDSKGVDKSEIVREALEIKSEDSFRLHAYTMSDKLQLIKEHEAAIITLNREELERFNYERGDSEGFVNDPLCIRGITSSYFLREDPDCIKVSARSVNNFPVSKVCEDLFNGGGHIQAAGGEFKGTLAECEALLKSSLCNYDEYIVKSK